MKVRQKIIQNYLNSIDIETMIMEKHNKEHLVGLARDTIIFDIEFLMVFDHIETEKQIGDIIEHIIESLDDSEIFPSRFSHMESGRKVFEIGIPDPSLLIVHIVLKKMAKDGILVEKDGLFSLPIETKRPNYNPRTFLN